MVPAFIDVNHIVAETSSARDGFRGQALQSNMPPVVAVMMGLVTGVFGGVLRDMVCNEIPKAFKDHRPYAVCSFAGGWTYVALWSADSPGWIALLGCLVVTVGLRALALWRNWQLPAWRA